MAYSDMVSRLEAEESLLAAQIQFLPHLKDRDRRAIIRRWEKETKRGTTIDGKRHDKHGREVVDDIDSFNAFLKSFNVI